MKKSALVLSLFLIAVAGCGDAPSTGQPAGAEVVAPSWQRLAEDALEPAQREQLQRAVAAQQEMAHTLMGELKAELESGGPAGAVIVCRDLAPMIADHISEENGLAIGRTSHRLRNPANTAPEWAFAVVDARVDDQTVFAGPEGELGVTLPIRVAKPCLACHGAPDALSEDVTTALAESYPDDQATGFAEGDLRGWFWIEVPARAATSDS